WTLLFVIEGLDILGGHRPGATEGRKTVIAHLDGCARSIPCRAHKSIIAQHIVVTPKGSARAPPPRPARGLCGGRENGRKCSSAGQNHRCRPADGARLLRTASSPA